MQQSFLELMPCALEAQTVIKMSVIGQLFSSCKRTGDMQKTECPLRNRKTTNRPANQQKHTPQKREDTPTAAPQEMKMIHYFFGGSQDDPEIFKGPSINLVPIQSCWRFTPPGVLYRLSNQLLSDLMDKNLGVFVVLMNITLLEG